MEDWEALTESSSPVALQCSASWCRPCQILTPQLKKAVMEYEGKIHYAYLDIDKMQEVAEMLQVSHVPTVFLVKDGELIESKLSQN